MEQPAFEMFHNVQRLKSDLNGDLITSGAGCLRRAS
jgi:hypothetical protein